MNLSRTSGPILIAAASIFASPVLAEPNSPAGAGQSTASEDPAETLKKTEAEVERKLDEFSKDNAHYGSLLAAQKLAFSLNPRTARSTASVVNEECLRLQLKVLLALAAARDPHYDPYAKENIVYSGGPSPEMDRKTLADLILRKKAYEDAAAENKRRLAKLNRELDISRALDLTLINIWGVTKIFLSENPAARNAAVAIVQKTITEKDLLDRYNSDSMPSLTW